MSCIKLEFRSYFQMALLIFSLLQDVSNAGVVLMPLEAKGFKHNIVKVEPTLWSQYKDKSGLTHLQGKIENMNSNSIIRLKRLKVFNLFLVIFWNKGSWAHSLTPYITHQSTGQES